VPIVKLFVNGAGHASTVSLRLVGMLLEMHYLLLIITELNQLSLDMSDAMPINRINTLKQHAASKLLVDL
jgi:hypothetical protein